MQEYDGGEDESGSQWGIVQTQNVSSRGVWGDD